MRGSGVTASTACPCCSASGQRASLSPIRRWRISLTLACAITPPGPQHQAAAHRPIIRRRRRRRSPAAPTASPAVATPTAPAAVAATAPAVAASPAVAAIPAVSDPRRKDA